MNVSHRRRRNPPGPLFQGGDNTRHFGVDAALAVIVLVSICHTAFAGDDPPPPNLAVVTTPKGSGREAEIARSLIPYARKNNYKLSPIHLLIDAKQISGTNDIENNAKKKADKAREAALAFDLSLAAQLWRQAADDLLGTETIALDSSLTADYLLEAGAASVEAGENDLALLYFRKALAVDGDVRPGPNISPRSKEAFSSALASGPSHFRIPHNRTLQTLCSSFNLDGILWISVGRDEDGLIVYEKLVLQNEESSEPETGHHPPSAEQGLDKWLSKERMRLETTISLKLPAKLADEKPWYRKWWLYTAIGGVVLAGAAGIVIGVALQPKEVDVVVHH
ncbi:MAG: hypothetical protein GY847_37385 [Proteobacteria bacterium]|nr:hypothetical protein [Pseudomonadota bacterium]